MIRFCQSPTLGDTSISLLIPAVNDLPYHQSVNTVLRDVNNKGMYQVETNQIQLGPRLTASIGIDVTLYAATSCMYRYAILLVSID
jgi:hypothetical protein